MRQKIHNQKKRIYHGQTRFVQDILGSTVDLFILGRMKTNIMAMTATPRTAPKVAMVIVNVLVIDGVVVVVGNKPILTSGLAGFVCMYVP